MEARSIEPKQLGGDGSHADGVPRPGGVIVTGAGVQGDTSTRGDFVAHCQQAEQSTPRQLFHLGECQDSRHQGDTTVAFGKYLAVVGVQGIDHPGAVKRHAGGRGRGSREQQRATAAVLADHIALGVPGKRGTAGPGGYAKGVEQGALGLDQMRVAQGVEIDVKDPIEWGKIRIAVVHDVMRSWYR